MLVACAPPPWTVPADPEPVMAPGAWDPGRIEVIEAGAEANDLLWLGDGPAVATGWGVWTPSAHVPTPGWSTQLAANGDALWVADEVAGLTVLDRSLRPARREPGPVYGVVGTAVARAHDVDGVVSDPAIRRLIATSDGWAAVQFPSGILEPAAHDDRRALDVADAGERWVLDRGRRVWRGADKVAEGASDLHACDGLVAMARGDGLHLSDGRSRVRGPAAVRVGCAPDGWLVAWADRVLERLDRALGVVATWELPAPADPPDVGTHGWTVVGSRAERGDQVVRLPGELAIVELGARGDQVAVAPAYDGVIAGLDGDRPLSFRVPGGVKGLVFAGRSLLVGLPSLGVVKLDLDGGDPALLRLPRLQGGQGHLCGDDAAVWAAWGTWGVLRIDPDTFEVIDAVDTPGRAVGCVMEAGRLRVVDHPGAIYVR